MCISSSSDHRPAAGPRLAPHWSMDNEWPALIGWSAGLSHIIGGCYSIKISRLKEIYQMLPGLDASMHFSNKIIIQEAITKQYHKEIILKVQNLNEKIECKLLASN